MISFGGLVWVQSRHASESLRCHHKRHVTTLSWLHGLVVGSTQSRHKLVGQSGPWAQIKRKIFYLQT